MTDELMERRYSRNDETEEEYAARMEARAGTVDRRRFRAGIPTRLRGLRWEELDGGENEVRAAAIARCVSWAAGTAEERGLLLTGPVGVGKTRMAATAAWARTERSAVRWLSVATLLHDLRGGFDSADYQAALEKLKPRPGVSLILDDLDKLKPTEHAVSSLYVAVNEWVEAELPLLVTMNQALDDLERDFGERFGAPIASRLAEHCHVVELSGRDRRIDPDG